MTHTIREAQSSDIGTIAHLMLVWDAELPEHLKQLNGDAAYAEQVASVIVASPNFTTKVLEASGKIIGAFVISKINGLFSRKPYGILNLMIYPKHRGGKMYGLRLMEQAIQTAKQEQLGWLESNPWSDAHGMQFVLERLGFMELTKGYALRLQT